MQPRILESNSDEFMKLEIVASILDRFAPKNYSYHIETVYFDAGQN